MARELTIKITADGSQAKAELGAVEKGVQGVTNASAKADQQVQKQVDSQAAAAKKIGAALGSVFSIQKISAAVDQVSASTSRIADAASRIGISAEAVQRLGFAASQSGSSIEAIAVAMGRMSDMLGSAGAEDKLAKIGLTLADIKGLTPDQTFLAMAEAIRGIEDPLKQADAATDVFGRGALELMPAIKAGFVEVGNQAPIMSNSVVESGDRAGDALQRMHDRMDTLKAQALVPLMGAFTQLPEAVQIGVAGILSFMPSLEGLALAIMAAGGPTAALGLLKGAAVAVGTFFSTTLVGLFSGAIAFFTTTLPAAIGTVLAFLGPQGLIAVAVLAVIAIWHFFGDEISAVVSKVYGVVKEWLIDKLGALWATLKEKLSGVGAWFLDMKNKAVDYAKQLYEGVKAWLVDKFAAVVQSIKAKVEAVTGFFADMYDKVVGNSYVPDMVNDIRRQFARLQDVMVNPTRAATTTVEGLFQSLMTKVSGWIDSLINKIPGIGSALQSISKIPGLDGLTGGLGGIAGDLLNRGIEWVGNKLRGGEEGMVVNPARDVFLRQFGPPGTGEGSGFMNLAAMLTQITGQEGGGNLFAWMAQSETMQSFTAAAEAIVSTLTAAGKSATLNFNEGTKGKYLDFGAGTPVMLHGKERVMTEAEGRAEAANSGGVTLAFGAGSIVVNGAKNANDLARELAPALVRQINRLNVGGTRNKMPGLRPRMA
jgi:hypothetical protein